MNLRPTDLLTVCGLTEQQLRHWKKVLPPIQAKRGNKPDYTQGEALALGLINDLTKCLRCKIQTFAPIAWNIFDDCKTSNWDRLEHEVAVITFAPMAWRTELKKNVLLEGDQLILDIGKRVRALRAEALGIELEGPGRQLELVPSIPAKGVRA